jgi:hypothetical protein
MRPTLRAAALAGILSVVFAPSAGAAAAERGAFGVSAGIATGDNGIGLGWNVGASYSSKNRVGPLRLRADATYQDHGSDLAIFGLSANAIIPAARVYGLAGVGWYDSNPGGSDVDITLGAGIRRGKSMYFEARWLSLDGFTTFPIVVGFTF